MVNYKLQEEDKERRAEAERIMVENQKKIEEQQRKMVRSKKCFGYSVCFILQDIRPGFGWRLLPRFDDFFQ